MKFSCRDGKRLSSRVWHQDELLNKKRRWLVGSAMPDGSQKKLKMPKILTDMSLTESYVRSDEVSYETLRINIEKSFGVFSDSQRSNHVVQDFLQLFETFNMESYSTDSSYFLKSFYSTLNVLSNNALCTVANLVTDKKAEFEKTRPKMKKIIKECLPNVLKESSYNGYPTLIMQLSQILEDPVNFRNKQLTLRTPMSPSLLSYIHKALTALDVMPIQDLNTMNRRLRSTPPARLMKFPPARFTGKREVLLERVKRRCQKVLSTLDDGDDLPTPFAKALSIVQLSLKQKTRCLDIMTSEFYPYSPEIVGLQNDLLRAIWLLPKVRIHELKNLQCLVDPEASCSVRSFRCTLRKYLMEYLFECDVIDIPEELLNVIGSLNRRSRRRARLFMVEMIDEDVEATLSISSHLKQTVSSLLLENIIDDKLEALESDDDDNESNDFDLAESGCCSFPGELKQGAGLSDIAEGMGSSIPSSVRMGSSIPSSVPVLTYQTCSPHVSMAQPKLDSYEPPMVGEFINKSNSEDHVENTSMTRDFVEKSNSGPAHMRETTIQELCDETSLVAYKLIGHLLDKFIRIDGRDTSEMTRYYLRGGSSIDSQGVENSLKTSMEATRTEVLIQSVQEILPNVPKSCIEKVKKLIG